MVKILNLSEIEAIRNVEENGKQIDIGSYQSLQSHPELNDFFLNNENRITVAITKLEPDSELPVHQHPMESVIMVISGEGEYFGEFEQTIKKGDIVRVPQYALHGFRAKKDTSLECISMQNDGEPIYRLDQENRVSFNTSAYEILCEQNECKSLEFSSLCKDIVNQIDIHGELFKTNLFGYIKRWSECFQVLLYLRQGNTLDSELSTLFLDHLEEEIGHQKYLANYTYTFDATFEGFCAWFERHISIVSDAEKTILMHMVLETAGDVFSSYMAGEKSQKETSLGDYIDLHSDLDEGHASMGSKQIEKFCSYDQERALQFNSDCWGVFNEMFSYIINKTKVDTLKAAETKVSMDSLHA
ncbi:cupin domain-containing protein [Vibrio cholerae]|nr:cupin domain-containing protein [Vibrio cholerae]